MSRNVDIVREMQNCFNERRWDDLVTHVSPSCVFIDPQSQVKHGKEGLRAYAQGWIAAFSNGMVTEARHYDAGDTVVTEFVGRGTQDGPLGPVPATGRTVTLPYLEIYHFDSDGLVSSGRAYADMLGLMAQLGVAPGLRAETDLRTREQTRSTR